MFSRIFYRTTTDLSPVTPQVQGEDSQQQQGSTSGNTLVQPSENGSSRGTRHLLEDASYPTPPNSKMPRFKLETTTDL